MKKTIFSILTLSLIASTIYCQEKADIEKELPAKAQEAVIEYVHPEALVSTEWLVKHLSDPSVRVIDARFPPNKTFYEGGHIPGAVFVNIVGDLSDTNASIPLMILPQDAFEHLMGRLGISNNKTVVVYDIQGGLWCSRMWWALRYYGHDSVKILDGGLAKWMIEGRPLEAGTVTSTLKTFQAHVRPELISTTEDIQAAIQDPKVHIIDALPEEYFTGEVRLYETHRTGHIPTAHNLPAPLFVNYRGELYPQNYIAQRIQRLGLNPDQKIITYCGAGYYGAFDLFVLYLLGYDQVSLYDGAWMEWGANPELPIETKR
jgi:thiosulfate/3-mercaptopyruvate sulfurtransferase